jgi:M6 family metalloprotease-like protein
MMRFTYVAAAALAAVAIAAPVAAAGGGDRDSGCRITSPPQGWPDGTSQGFDTNLHHGLDSDWRKHIRPVGKVRAVMLFVDFPNAPGAANPAPYDTPQAYYDFLAPQGIEWFERSSYGRFDLEITPVRRWYRMSREDTFYEMERVVGIENQRRYLGEAVRLADPDVDFRRYDIVYLVPSRNASAIPASPEYNDYAGLVRADGRRVEHGVTFGQDMWLWGFRIINHETGHLVSLPESYNASGVPEFHNFVGGWDTMGAVIGHAPDLMAWNKWKLDWLRGSQVDCVDRRGLSIHRLTPVETAGGTKMVVVRTGRYTAWIAELRRPLGNDATVCDPGVLVYRLDASIPNGDGSIRVHDARPGSGQQGRCGELDIGALGLGAGETPAFADAGAGVTIRLLRERGDEATLAVLKR